MKIKVSMFLLAILASFVLNTATSVQAKAAMDAATEAKLKEFLAGPQRSEENKARDKYRHPLETLKFFGLSQSMSVMEIWPAGGWWTEFLAPVLRERGRYFAANPGDSADFKAELKKNPALYGRVTFVALDPSAKKETPVAPGSMDMVLTFRNLHNWMDSGNVEQMVGAMYESLKPGGYLGIEEHRGPNNAAQDPKAAMGYVREDYAIKLFEASGFKLVAKSEINANAKDTKDYPKGVWTLPPTYAEEAKDRAKYAAIGESDRFTLLFQKPAN